MAVNRRMLFAVFLFIMVFPVHAQEIFGERFPGESKPLFASDEMIELNVRADLQKLLNDRGEEGERHPGLLEYTTFSGDCDSFPVMLETRGNFRKRPENCDFPPLMLRMEEDEVEGTLFRGQDRLKLVTHCRTHQELFESLVIKEYLIYRWYNALTPCSYRVRLARIRYFDRQSGELYTENNGFILERTRDMAARLGGEPVDFAGIHPLRLSHQHYTLLALFEYLIMNNDWAVEVLHNVKLVSRGPGYPLIPVGYDFDWSGLIDAPYREVTSQEMEAGDLMYKGLCGEKEVLWQVIGHYLDRKEELYRLVEQCGHISPEDAVQMTERLDKFFALLNNRRQVRRVLLHSCIE
ncbi:MAG: hypothetical protein ACP5D1_10530 [Bacteroidales bacterium]